jgi:hypothetical protein
MRKNGTMDGVGNFSQFKDIMENDCRNLVMLQDVFRNTNFTGNLDPVPAWEIYIKCIVYTLILGTAFFGNLSVLVILTMNRNMRSTTNIFIANLAIGDMFIAICPMWVKLVESITMRWPFGEFICKLWPFLQGTSQYPDRYWILAPMTSSLTSERFSKKDLLMSEGL